MRSSRKSIYHIFFFLWLRLVCSCNSCYRRYLSTLSQVRTSRVEPGWWSYLWLVGWDTSWLKLEGFLPSACFLFFFFSPRQDINRCLASADVRYIYSRSSLRRLKLNSTGLLEKATNKSLVPLVIEAVMVSLGRPCISSPSVINSCATLKSQPHSRGGRSPVGSNLRHKQRPILSPDTKSVCVSSHVSCLRGLMTSKQNNICLHLTWNKPIMCHYPLGKVGRRLKKGDSHHRSINNKTIR